MAKKSEIWLENNVVNNVEEMKEIGELAHRSILDKLCINMSPELCIASYGIIFETILEVLKSKQKEYSEFAINIANVIQVSYNTNNDDEAEKMGNFMPFIQQIANGPIPDSGIDSSIQDSIQICTAWNSSHITEQPDVINEIATKAVSNLSSELNTKTMNQEIIIPIFCLVHEQIVSYVKLQRVDSDLSEYELDVAGLYSISAIETDKGTENIEYTLSVYSKMSIKDDLKASDDFE